MEPGRDSCRKVEILPPAHNPMLYMSADIAEVTLRKVQQRLVRCFPELRSVALRVHFDRLLRIARLLTTHEWGRE